MKKILILLALALLVAVGCLACNGAPPSDTDASAEPTDTVTESPSDTDDATDMTNDATEEPTGDTEMEYKGFKVTEANKKWLQIYCDKLSGEKAKAAAADLRNYIKKMTGWSVPIVNEYDDSQKGLWIVVGACKLTEELGYETASGYPDNESVTVAQNGRHLVLMGNDDGSYNGTQFAVNLLLESLGCGWFADDPLWTVVPSLNSLDLEIGEVYLDFKPRYSSRYSRVVEASPGLAHRWYQGGEKSLLGHWLYQVVPKTEYSEHPDWFALVKGSRDPADINYWHFCYSNEEFAERIADEAIKKFDSNPSLVSLTIAANDGWEKDWCECRDCYALGNPSDVMVHFANNVAQKVALEHPNKRLQIYSYHNTFLPPENKVTLHSSVELVLCRETNMYQPLDEDFMMPKGKDPVSHIEFVQSWRKNALEYIEKTSPTHVAVWDWYCISADEKEWINVPWVQGEVAIRNQKVYDELGAEYVFYDHGPTDGYNEPNETKTYVLRWPLWFVAAKASFDPSLSERDILGDACNKLFGGVSEEMLEYFMLLSDISKKCTAYSNTWVPASPAEVYTMEDRRQIRTLVDEIVEKAKLESEDVQKRVAQQLEYWMY